ncbi:5-(carboxyamino)imidazole ribonucleotide synthase [Pajaroellobacter abortibovis]|uniref:N5-carboxyaminoimidazole ribonucleotide synthase n=1 Tax=Pajaroellobacter abortibovis TaxID=1882918 RepID=A0A1L6MYY6_9BACT|nr:5-(carboxyamino)imidazole ribonucleotide synthase [Pajaroellobacter abortibovis]APS00753.1 5-(carboxyamino)imidazole ribonucleotide synthase [Pajaroellobacter abortibovis]
MKTVFVGSTLGILGGGQLGRMTAMAARSLGFSVHVLDPDPVCPARPIADLYMQAPLDDAVSIGKFAQSCSIITMEIEKIGLTGLAAAGQFVPVRPSKDVLAIVQNRIDQKDWLSRYGFPVGPYAPVRSEAELTSALRQIGLPSLLKTSFGGYDGRGQVLLSDSISTLQGWSSLGRVDCILERLLPLQAEFSILVARRPQGEIAVYPPAMNRHKRGILAFSTIPAMLPRDAVKQGEEIVRSMAELLHVEGLLTVEFFLTEGGDVFVNELAPRPHNSFHGSEKACRVSQFEQFVRAVCDWPLGQPELIQPVSIANLLGEHFLEDPTVSVAAVLNMPNVGVVLYGKKGACQGRKMGHLWAAASTPEGSMALVQQAHRRWSDPS